MNDVFHEFISVSVLVLCLVIWILTWVIRRGVESRWEGAKTNKFWNDFVLPMLPIVVGGLFGLLVISYPYPALFAMAAGRVSLGMVCGLFAAHIYKIVKKWAVREEGPNTTSKPAEDDPIDLLDDK